VCDSFGGHAQTDDASDPLRAAIEKGEVGILDGFAGRFVRGETTLYGGTFQAQSSTGPAPGSPLHTAQIPDGNVVAALDPSSAKTQLFVHSVAAKNYIQFAQESDPNVTSVFMILGEDTTGGLSATCTSCFPKLNLQPQAIDVDNLSVSAPTEWAGELRISATAHLRAIAPCTMTYDELATVDARTAGNFAPSGDEMVWHKAAVYNDAPNEQCGNATQYTVDLFIATTHPWDFGVRNYVAGQTTYVCHQDHP
jgi:hypothetical protein